MTIAQSILPEFDQEIATTRRVLERVPADKLDWRPHPKSYTMGQLANHLARVCEWVPTTLEATEFDVNPAEGGTPQPTIADSVEGMLEVLDKTSSEARAVVEKTTDEAFMVEWSLKSGGETRFAAPRIAVFRSFIMNHIIHHRGQLTVYLRMNDVPLPQVYGPTADETDM